MPESAVSVVTYNSIYRHEVDEKRRVQIPSKWRPEQLDVEFTLIFWPKHKAGACLRVLPRDQMAKLRQDIDAMPNSDPNKVVLKRFIGSSSIQVALDKGGRICIPEDMAKRAGIEVKQEVVLVGLLDRFEIWSSVLYPSVEAFDAVIAQRAFDMME